MMLGQLDENERVLRSGVGRVSRGPVQQDANVRDDHLAFPLRNDRTDCFFDLCDHLFGLFDAQPGRRTNLDGELSGIALRKKFRTDQFKNQH